MPQIEDYPYTVTVNDVESFCEALKRACDMQPDYDRLKQFLQRNTWEVRASELLAVVEGA